MTDRRPPSRFLQFRLQTLLWAIVAVALAVGWWTDRQRRPAPESDWPLRGHFKVTYRENLSERRYTTRIRYVAEIDLRSGYIVLRKTDGAGLLLPSERIRRFEWIEVSEDEPPPVAPRPPPVAPRPPTVDSHDTDE